jgi:hypothetical protein
MICMLMLPDMVSAETSAKPREVTLKVREYYMAHEDRIIRELVELFAIPNVATDTTNIQKNAALLANMFKARGFATQLLSITGRGPVVFGSLLLPTAKHRATPGTDFQDGARKSNVGRAAHRC